MRDRDLLPGSKLSFHEVSFQDFVSEIFKTSLILSSGFFLIVVMECWSIGVLERKIKARDPLLVLPLLQHSNTTLLHSLIQNP